MKDFHEALLNVVRPVSKTSVNRQDSNILYSEINWSEPKELWVHGPVQSPVHGPVQSPVHGPVQSRYYRDPIKYQVYCIENTEQWSTSTVQLFQFHSATNTVNNRPW